MRLKLRKFSAVFLAAVMLLQFVFTIPASVFADMSEEEAGTVVKAVFLVREDGEAVSSADAGEELLLQIEWAYGPREGDLQRSVKLILPEEMSAEEEERVFADEEDVSAGTLLIQGKEILLEIDQEEFQRQGVLEIPVRLGELEPGLHVLGILVGDEAKTIDVLVEEAGADQLPEESVETGTEPGSSFEEALEVESSLEPVQEDEPRELQQDAPVMEAAEAGSTEIDSAQFLFNNIYFLDSSFDESVDNPEDFVFDVDRPYDLNIKDNYGLLYFDFSLVDNHTVKAGDTFTFLLPEELRPVSGISGELGSIGKWFVAIDGTVRFEFSEGVNGDDVEGHFWFEVKLDEEKMDETIIQEIRFEVNPDFIMSFPVKPLGGSLLGKNGTINNNGYNASEAYWSIDINTSLDKLVNASVSDVIPGNMKLMTGSLEAYRLDVTSSGVKTEGAKLEADKYELIVDAQGNPKVSFVNLTDEESRKAYRIRYTTEIIEPAEGFDGTKTFRNKAVLTNDGKSYTASSTVSSGYGRALDKLNPDYKWEDQTLSWSIRYNYNEKYIGKDQATITDTWTPGGVMELMEGAFHVYPVTMNSSGNATVSETPIDASLYTLNVNGMNGFTLAFNNDVENQAYEIRYKTRLLGSEGTGVVDKSGSVTNRVVTGTEKSDGSSGSWSQRGVIKSSTGYDVEKKEIGWKVLLNQNGYLMENLVVTDTFTGDGLTLLEDTVVIKSSSRTYVKGVDYLLEYTEPVFGVASGGFTVRFLADVEEPLTMTYTTHFERNGDGTATYGNKGAISWTENGVSYDSETGVVKVTPEGYTGPNGVKNGFYNAQTKEITWSIHTNYARLPIKAGYSILDEIPLHQKLVEGSLEVFTYNVDNKGNITGETPMDGADYTVLEPAENGNKLEVRLLDTLLGTKASIGIRFRTVFADEWIRDARVENTAEVHNGGDSFTLEATVTVPGGGEYVHKSGVQTGIYNERVDWTVYLNRSQSLIRDYTLTDNPDLNSVLLEDTFAVYKTVVSDIGEVTKSAEMLEEGVDYDLVIQTDNETGKQSFILKFRYDIRDAYILEYSSYIDPLVGKGEAIENAYTAEGITTEEITDGDVSSEVKNVNSGGAGGSSVRGGIEIRKIAEGNTQNVLEGAEFHLYTKDGAQLLRSGITDAEGIVRFGGLRRGEYLLKEVKAPEGYVISRNLANGVPITLSHENDGEFRELAYTNALTKINLRKVNEAGVLIQGEARFSLYASDGTLLLQNLATVNGRLTLTDLAEGSYYLQETRAPEGYILNPQKYSFTIKINANGTQNVPRVDVPNYKGQAEFMKTDGEGNPLAGAVFHLYRGMDRIGEELVSDGQGKVIIKNLSPGTYDIREVKAPSGYLLNTEEIRFTIPESVQGRPEVFDLGTFINHQGAVRLYKADEFGNPLEGAEFKIVDTENRIIKTGLVTGEDGRLYVGGLAPGSYSFIETKAPAGYVLEPTPIPFIISASAEGTPVVVSAGHKENYQGSVILEKINEEEEALSGAVFELFQLLTGENMDRILVGTYTSDAEGEVMVSGLAPGNYAFIEKTAPEGYLINSDAIPFTIMNEAVGRPARVKAGTAVNYKGSAELLKTDEGGNPLTGAEFQVLNAEMEPVLTGLLSEDDGKVFAEELAPGRYYFQEKKAPEGYLLNEELLAFEIEAEAYGKPLAVEAGTLMNYKGSAELMKTSEEGTPLSGAVFALYTEAGELVDEELITDEEGKVRVGNLSPGVYEFREVRAPEGHIRNLDVLTFTIHLQAEGKPETVDAGTLVNYQGQVMLKKTNEEGNALAGAVFALSFEGEVLDTFTTDAEGEISIDGLVPGKYTLTEVQAPEGYLRNTESVGFIIPEEQKGIPELIALEDFINYKGSVLLLKTDEEGKALSGAVFELFQILSGENMDRMLVGTYTSDENGEVTVEGLMPGNYAFMEKTAPEGYFLNTDAIPFTILNEAEGRPARVEAGTAVNYKGSAELVKTDEGGNPLTGAEFQVLNAEMEPVLTGLLSEEEGRVFADELAPGRYYFQETKAPEGYLLNEELIAFEIEAEASGKPLTVEAGTLMNYKGSAELMKTSEEGTPLSGAVFALYSEGGELVDDELITDEEGKVQVDNLSPGVYEFREVSAPVGHIRNLYALTFTIHAQAEGKPETVDAGTLVNYQGKVMLMKTDEKGNALAGAVFALSFEGEVLDTFTTDAEGEISIDGLAPGNYTLKELQSPEGFILDETIYDFTVLAEALGEPEVIRAGDAVNYKGVVFLKKTDAEGLGLEGAVFTIRDGEENLITKVESDADGSIRVEGLAPGNYTMNEVEAPAGYIRNETVLTFTIESTLLGKPEAVDLGVFVNHQGALTIRKVDEEGKALAGAEFRLSDSSGNIYGEKLVSDSAGEIVVTGLKPGSYVLVETKAPEGYLLSETEHTFEIKASHEGEPEAISVTVVNEEMPDEENVGNLPSAGSKDSGFLPGILGMLSIAAGLSYLMKQKKRA